MSHSLLGCIVLAALGVGGLVGAVAAVNSSAAPALAADPDAELTRSVAALTADLGAVKQRLVTLEQKPAVAERSESPASRETEPSAAKHDESKKPADPAAEKEAAIAAAAKELTPQ